MAKRKAEKICQCDRKNTDGKRRETIISRLKYRPISRRLCGVMWNKAKRLNLERSPPSGQHGIAPFHRFHGGWVGGGGGVAVHQRLQHYYPWLLSGSGEVPWRLGGEPRRIWQAAKGPSDTWSRPRVCPSLPSTAPPPEPGVKRGARQTTIASIHMHVNKVTRWSSAAQSSEATQPGTPQQFWSSSSRTSPPPPPHKCTQSVRAGFRSITTWGRVEGFWSG